VKRTSYDRHEQALLVAAFTDDQDRHFAEYQVEELRNLALTAGAQVERVSTQHLKSINPATFIGSGKLDELQQTISGSTVDIVLFNRDLSPVQQRNLERTLGRRIVDRSELILDIFAQHAHTKDGKIQVELAQLRYLRPRLTGRGIDLSRLGGGIGTRGPGETQLEVDRRRIDQRIDRLRKEWENIRTTRRLQRKSRERHNIPSGVLVGYTNAGKSTLLNRITSANVTARDQLFSTLDTTTRRLYIPAMNQSILLSDTVGFITDLPKPLLAAFRATLEIVEESRFLIHVCDASSPFLEEHLHAVYEVLDSLNCADKPILTVFNKMDRVTEENQLTLREIERRVSPSLRCSALRDDTLEPLVDKIAEMVLYPPESTPPAAPPDDDDKPFNPLNY
jgi:GTP-binding protein HflX